MATVKKVRKAQTGDRFGMVPFKGVCGKDAECLARREERKQARDERRASGETLGQRILKGVGLATQEGIERRQARKAERSDRREERRENRQYRREERRANRGGGGDAPGAWKKGGKMAKKPIMKKGGKVVKKTMVKKSKKK